MFSLEDNIKQWGVRLQQSDTCQTRDIEELEGHLRDEIAYLSHVGLSEDEAFIVSTRRLGHPSDLANEYAKINPGVIFRKRLLWMCIGLLFYLLATYIAGGLSRGVALFTLVTFGKSIRGYKLGLFVESLRIMMLVGSMLAFVFLAKSFSCRTALPQWLRSTKAKVFVFFGLLLLDVTLWVCRLVLPIVTARLVGPEDFGRMAMISSYVDFFSPIIATILLAVIIFRLAITGNKRAAFLST